MDFIDLFSFSLDGPECIEQRWGWDARCRDKGELSESVKDPQSKNISISSESWETKNWFLTHLQIQLCRWFQVEIGCFGNFLEDFEWFLPLFLQWISITKCERALFILLKHKTQRNFSVFIGNYCIWIKTKSLNFIVNFSESAVLPFSTSPKCFLAKASADWFK